MNESEYAGVAPSEADQGSAALSSAAPVREADRIQVLDVLRGVAIFGIFMVNIAFFSMPIAEMFETWNLADGPTADMVSYGIVRVFFEFKFVSMFSFLFGAGLILQLQRAEAKKAPFVGMYLRRTLLLMLVGGVHATLIWYGDILFIYSWVALVLLMLRRAPAQIMLVIAGILLGFGLLLTAGLAFLQSQAPPIPADSAPEAIVAPELESESESETSNPIVDAEGTEAVDDAADAELVEMTFVEETLEALGATFSGDGEPMRALEQKTYSNGPFVDAAIMRTAMWGTMVMMSTFLSGFGVRILAMFLLGAACMKLGFHLKERRRWHINAVLLGIIVGLGGEISAFMLQKSAGFQHGSATIGIELLHFGCSFFLCLGYIGAVCLMVHSGLFRPVLHAIACVGRMALTNYLMQSIIATGIFYWWGLGKFGTVDRPTQLMLVVGIYVGQVIFSVIWMHFFRIGPFEWVWRSLTYARLQPVRRSA